MAVVEMMLNIQEKEQIKQMHHHLVLMKQIRTVHMDLLGLVAIQQADMLVMHEEDCSVALLRSKKREVVVDLAIFSLLLHLNQIIFF